MNKHEYIALNSGASRIECFKMAFLIDLEKISKQFGMIFEMIWNRIGIYFELILNDLGMNLEMIGNG